MTTSSSRGQHQPPSKRSAMSARQRADRQRELSKRRATEQLEARRRWRRLTIGTVAGVAVVTATVVVVALGTGGSSRPRSPSGSTMIDTMAFSPGTESGLLTAAPPWPLPADSRFDIANAGLTAASGETTVVHYHVHLDIIDNGSAIAVPAGVGFVIQGGRETGLTSLHTHDTSGVIHIESPTDKAFVLGQVLTEWGVAIGPGHVGGLATGGGNVMRLFVNGHPYTGDPGAIVLRGHQEIVAWFGPTAATPDVPSSYSFPQGE